MPPLPSGNTPGEVAADPKHPLSLQAAAEDFLLKQLHGEPDRQDAAGAARPLPRNPAVGRPPVSVNRVFRSAPPGRAGPLQGQPAKPKTRSGLCRKPADPWSKAKRWTGLRAGNISVRALIRCFSWRGHRTSCLGPRPAGPTRPYLLEAVVLLAVRTVPAVAVPVRHHRVLVAEPAVDDGVRRLHPVDEDTAGSAGRAPPPVLWGPEKARGSRTGDPELKTPQPGEVTRRGAGLQAECWPTRTCKEAEAGTASPQASRRSLASSLPAPGDS